MIIIREPCLSSFSDYAQYKPWLRRTFRCRCVFCIIHELELGGMDFFTIDHMAPKSKKPELINDYHNLLYACDECNHWKKNDWYPGDPAKTGKGYLNPCKHDYDKHFRIGDDGKIRPLSQVAKYMVERLYLNRSFVVGVRRKRKDKEQLIAHYQKILLQARRTLEATQDEITKSQLRRVISDLEARKSNSELWLHGRNSHIPESYWKTEKQLRVGGTLADALKRTRQEFRG